MSLTIDGISVSNAPVRDVGVLESGEMEIPGAAEVGWYRFGPSPGQPGSAVLAAHIAFDGRDGVFRRLAGASIGARVEVMYSDGSTRAFEVVELAQYSKEELPTSEIFSKSGDPRLLLITCGGDFNPSLRSYTDNIVAYAIPIPD
ncbi:MAG: class F sortase [Acidimicrobiia bacterium]|nr:class F sortase [Acidimicrobiia bacterium]